MALCIKGLIFSHGNHCASPQHQCSFSHVFGQVGKCPARHTLAQSDPFIGEGAYDVQVLNIPGQQPDAVTVKGRACAPFDSQWHFYVIAALRQGAGRGGRSQAAELQHMGALLAGVDLAHHGVGACCRGCSDQQLELDRCRRAQAVRVTRCVATHGGDKPILNNKFDPEMMKIILQCGPAAKAGSHGFGFDQNAASEYRHGDFLYGTPPSAGNAWSSIFSADIKFFKVYDNER